MAPVNIRTGPVDASDAARDVPPQKWWDLTQARRSFTRTQLPYDCRSVITFVEEAEEYRMWERTGYANLDEYIRVGLELDPDMVHWARQGLARLDTSQPIPYGQAVETGKTAAQKLHEAPKLKQHGGTRNTGQDYNIILPSNQGTEAKYLAGRLKRDHPEIADRVARGEYRSIRAAALDAGIIKPKKTVPIDTPERAIQALLRVFSADELRRALDNVDERGGE